MSTTYEKVVTAFNITDSSELPEQLLMYGGEIRTRDGHTPLFPAIPDGTVLTVTNRDSAVATIDELKRLREENFKLRLEAAVERSYDTTVEHAPEPPPIAPPKTYNEWCGCQAEAVAEKNVEMKRDSEAALLGAFKRRAWTPDEVPLGAELRVIGGVNETRSTILAYSSVYGEVCSVGANTGHPLFGTVGFSPEACRELFEYRLDKHSPWQRCETIA